jgi:hypothetical protein
VVAFFIYLAAFLLWIFGKCIYSSEWVAQFRARNMPFSELESVSIMETVLLLCMIFPALTFDLNPVLLQSGTNFCFQIKFEESHSSECVFKNSHQKGLNIYI